MTIDARSLMIPQPEGSNVYFRPLSRCIAHSMCDDLGDDFDGTGWTSGVHETRWAPHMPLAGRPVHPE